MLVKKLGSITFNPKKVVGKSEYKFVLVYDYNYMRIFQQCQCLV